jgi:hypothetical protein
MLWQSNVQTFRRRCTHAMALLARYACQTDVDVFLARIIAIFIYNDNHPKKKIYLWLWYETGRENKRCSVHEEL